MLTNEEIQQLAELIEKARTVLTTETGEKPHYVFIVNGEIRGETAWINIGNYKTFSLKDGKVEVYDQLVY